MDNAPLGASQDVSIHDIFAVLGELYFKSMFSVKQYQQQTDSFLLELQEQLKNKDGQIRELENVLSKLPQ